MGNVRLGHDTNKHVRESGLARMRTGWDIGQTGPICSIHQESQEPRLWMGMVGVTRESLQLGCSFPTGVWLAGLGWAVALIGLHKRQTQPSNGSVHRMMWVTDRIEPCVGRHTQVSDLESFQVRFFWGITPSEPLDTELQQWGRISGCVV